MERYGASQRDVGARGANVGAGSEEGGLLKMMVSSFLSHVEALLFLPKKRERKKKHKCDFLSALVMDCSVGNSLGFYGLLIYTLGLLNCFHVSVLCSQCLPQTRGSMVRYGDRHRVA